MEYLRCAQLAGERAHGWDWDGILNMKYKFGREVWTKCYIPWQEY